MTDSTLTAVHHRTLKVMLVDDQRLARTGFSLMLAKTGTVDVIAEASDGQQAIQVLDSRYRSCDPLPNVILMDVRMPVMDGIEATRRITISYPSVKVLVLTTYDEDDYAFGALPQALRAFYSRMFERPSLPRRCSLCRRGTRS